MSDLSCLWKVHTFPLIAVYQLASGLWIPRWNISFVSAQAHVLKMARLILRRAEQPRSAKSMASTNCIIFWGHWLLAFSILEEEGEVPLSTFHFSIRKRKKKVTTFGAAKWKWKIAQSLWEVKSTKTTFPPLQRSTLFLSSLLIASLFDSGFQLETKH